MTQRSSSSRCFPLAKPAEAAANTEAHPLSSFSFEPEQDRAPRAARADVRRDHRSFERSTSRTPSFFGAQMTAMDSATKNASGAHRQAHPQVQPGPPGRDHHRAHGDHRWRRGAQGLGAEARAGASGRFVTSASLRWRALRRPRAASCRGVRPRIRRRSARSRRATVARAPSHRRTGQGPCSVRD